MGYINLKISKKNNEPEIAERNEGPRYPYGSEIIFEDEVLDRVKGLADAGAGEEVEFKVKGYVSRVSMNDEGGDKKCVSVQVTDVDFGKRMDDMDAKEYKEARGK